jgi:ATP-dependent Clp protease protease subunit
MGRPVLDSTARPQASHGVSLEQLLVAQDNSRNVFLHSEVSENSVASAVAQMLHLAEVSRDPIHLIVSTYGGSADEMFGLYDTIKLLPCPVHTVGLGKVMSAGVLLLAAGARGHRLMGARSRIMIHSVSAGIYGNVFDIENETRELRRLHDLTVSSLVQETRMTRRQVERLLDPKLDVYLTPDEAVRLGIIDKIIGRS